MAWCVVLEWGSTGMGKAHIAGSHRTWTDEHINTVEYMYCVEGRTLEEIAAVVPHTTKAIQFQIHTLGFKLTLQAKAVRRVRGIRKPGRVQKAIIDYLTRCGSQGGYIGVVCTAPEFIGYEVNQIERSLSRLIKNRVVKRDGILYKMVDKHAAS
jgi:hypothetical protein